MKRLWVRYLKALRLVKWPVWNPGEQEELERKDKIRKLFGK